MAYIRWTQLASAASVHSGRAIGSRASIFTHVSDEWLGERAKLIDVPRQNPIVLADPAFSWISLLRARKGQTRTSATYRRRGTWRQYLSISILMVPFSDFGKRSNALPCQVVGLRDACWEKTVTSCSFVVENSRAYRTIRLYYVINI